MSEEKKTVPCPDCEAQIELPEEPEVGDVLVCSHCGVELELTNTQPPQVDYLLAEK